MVTLRLPRASAPRVDKVLHFDDEAWERRRTPVRRLRILVAEDHPVNLKYLNLLIERMGHQAVFCENGFEALQILNRESFEMFNQLLDMLFKAPDGTAPVLQKALEDEDLESIVYHGHRLKGSCMLMGLRALTTVSSDIEKSSQAGDVKALRELKEVLAVDIADTLAALPLMARLAKEVEV